MALDPANIIYTYSGGISNSNPNNSLGGASSVTQISGNNLFDDITDADRLTGKTDYRCFYVHNEDAQNSLYNIIYYFDYNVLHDTTVQIGFNTVNEQQTITILNPSYVTGGTYFNINYIDAYVSVSWNSDPYILAASIQSQIRDIMKYENSFDGSNRKIFADIQVNPTISSSEWVYTVVFTGRASNRKYETMSTNNGDLTFTTGFAISVQKSVVGSPINSTATNIDNVSTPPSNISFVDTTSFLCDLRPGDLIPVWVKRITPSNANAISGDGFNFRMTGNVVS